MAENIGRHGVEYLVTLRVLYKHTCSRWFLSALTKGVNLMARGKSGKSADAARQSKGAWTQFVNVSMSSVSWDDVKTAFPAGKGLFEQLQVLLDNHYRVSFSYDQRTDSVSCSLSGKGDDHAHSGKTLVSFAPTWVEAVQVSLYKHYILLQEDWQVDAPNVARPTFG